MMKCKSLLVSAKMVQCRKICTASIFSLVYAEVSLQVIVAMTSAINPISLFLTPYINDFELSYSVGRSWLMKSRNFGSITMFPCLCYSWKKIHACMVNSALRAYIPFSFPI